MSNGKSKNLPGKNLPAKGPSPAANRPADPKSGPPPAGKPGAQTAQSAKAAAPLQPVVPVHVPPLYRCIDWVSFILTFLVVFAGYLWRLAPDLMRTLRGPAAPNNPTDADIAAEYFGISCDGAAAFVGQSIRHR